MDGTYQVELFGIRDYEISIEVSEQQLRRYGISFDQIVGAIRGSSSIFVIMATSFRTFYRHRK